MYSCQDLCAEQTENKKIDNTLCVYELLTDYGNSGLCQNLLDGYVKPKISPFFTELYTVLTLKLFFHKDLQIMNFALMQTKHQQNELTQSMVLCQWACGRGSNKRGLTQTNSLKSSKSSLHEIARDSGRAIGGSPILSGQIMRKSEEGLIICPWGGTRHSTTALLFLSSAPRRALNQSDGPTGSAAQRANQSQSNQSNCYCVSLHPLLTG